MQIPDLHFCPKCKFEICNLARNANPSVLLGPPGPSGAPGPSWGLLLPPPLPPGPSWALLGPPGPAWSLLDPPGLLGPLGPSLGYAKGMLGRGVYPSPPAAAAAEILEGRQNGLAAGGVTKTVKTYKNMIKTIEDLYKPYKNVLTTDKNI